MNRYEDDEVPDPLILELVSDGDNVRPVLVKKCPPEIPEWRNSLNQRGHDAWPEITCWPHSLHYALSTGFQKSIPAGSYCDWSRKFFNQEIHVILKERKEQILGVLKELNTAKAYPRPKGTQHEIGPRPEDFGEEWYRELQDMNKKRRR